MRTRITLLIVTLACLAAGAVARFVRSAAAAHAIWLVGVVVMGTPIVFRTIRGAIHGRLATDVVASLSIIGAVVLGQPLAGLVIVLMQTGGEALEQYAEGRASAAVQALEAAAPRVAHLVRGATVDDVPATHVLRRRRAGDSARRSGPVRRCRHRR